MRKIIVSILALFLPVNIYADKNLDVNHFSIYRGINVTFHTNPSAADFGKISEWGANLIRLVIHADPNIKGYDKFYNPDGITFNEKAFKKLDAVLDMAANKKLKVIIATHTLPGTKDRLIWDDYIYWARVEKLWSYISKRYKNHSAVIGFHPVDEPNLLLRFGTKSDRLQMRLGHWSFPKEWENTPKDYFGLVERVGTIINRIAPAKIVVISGIGLWGNPINYNWMHEVDIDNAIYSFNMYIPHSFSNSGKGGRKSHPYNREKQKHKVIKAMLPVLRFSEKHNVRIIVSGFGSSAYTEDIGAKEWMEDILSYIDEHRWSSAYWTYSINFRNPEFISNGKTIERSSEITERLSILKQYWQLNLNHETTPINAHITGE